MIANVDRLCGRWRKAEELGDDGLRGAQQRGDQRRQVEVALAGGAHDAGEHLLGVGTVARAVAAAHLADDHGGPDGLFGAPVGGVERYVVDVERTWSATVDVSEVCTPKDAYSIIALNTASAASP